MASELGTEGTSDPTAGGNAGSQAPVQQQGTPAPQSPAGRSYTDSDMASARRSWEADSRRREQTLRQELEQTFSQRFIPREQPKTNDLWSQVDPQTAQILRGLLEQEFSTRLAPLETLKTQQEDASFRNEESELKTRFQDYGPNRLAILEFGIQRGIGDPEAAYHAWRSATQWPDTEAIKKGAIAEYLKKKTAQASGTPAVEGRGGGAPSSKQDFKGKDGRLDRDAMDAAAAELWRSAQE